VNKKVLLIGAAIVVPIVVILFMNLGRDPRKVESPLVGRQMIDFRLREVGTTRTVDLSSFRGRPIVVNFWATWCVPCYAEHRVLASVATMMGSQVQFVGVVFDDDEAKILQFLNENGHAYPALEDEGGKVAIAYGVYGVPETFFIDKAGTIVAKHEGPLDEITLTNYVAAAMGGFDVAR
jgi:cytochrome c biogenesis protein CcmG/thiol:disulfide interchange protein DsbE